MTDNQTHAAIELPASPLRAWAWSHGYGLLSSLGRFVRNPLSHLLTLGVLALALALPSIGGLVMKNLRTVSSALTQPGDISLFLRSEITLERAQALQAELGESKLVAKSDLTTPEEGLAEFRESTRFTDALELVGENPLPYVVVLSLESDTLRSAQVLPFVEQLRALNEVEIVQFDQEWLLRLKSMLALAERLVWVIGVLLALTVLLVIGNTIRLEIGARADEIQITRLIGATNAFVRRPFLYSGFWFGACGALLAIALVAIAVHLLQPVVQDFARSYGSAFQLQGLSVAEALNVLAAGALLGWLGALMATTQHLRRAESPD
jgi:cell division transport system permease protein